MGRSQTGSELHVKYGNGHTGLIQARIIFAQKTFSIDSQCQI